MDSTRGSFNPNRVNGDLRGLLGGNYQAQEGRGQMGLQPEPPPTAIAQSPGAEQSGIFEELMTRQAGSPQMATGAPNAPGVQTPMGIGAGADNSKQAPAWGRQPATGNPYQPYGQPAQQPWQPNPMMANLLNGRGR